MATASANAVDEIMESTLNVGAWRSRMERNEVHADKKWQKELQKRQQLR